MTITLNVPYGPNTAIQVADLYIANPGSSFCFLMIHGGGMVGGDKSFDASYNNGIRLYGEGYNVVMMNYRLANPVYITGQRYPQPNVNNAWPAPLIDVQLAVRWLRAVKNFRQVISWGDSAGATLSVLLACHNNIVPNPYNLYRNVSPKVDASIAHSTMSNFVAVYTDYHPDNTDYAGPKTSFNTNNEQTYAISSIVTNAAGDTSPVAFSHGTQDNTILYDQAIQMKNILSACGVAYNFQSYNGGHVFAGLTMAARTAICENAENWVFRRLGI